MIYHQNLEALERALDVYRSIRQENQIFMTDLIKNNMALATNQELLCEAALNTASLTNKEEICSHEKAQEVLLLWCLIYCEKVLNKKYGWNDRNAETVKEVSNMAVFKGFTALREAINKHFEQTPEERYRNGSGGIRAYVCRAALNAYCDAIQKNTVISQKEVSAAEAEELRKQNIEVEELKSDSDIRYVAKLRKEKFVPMELKNVDKEEYTIPDVTDYVIDNAVHGAMKEMDDQAIYDGVRDILAYVRQKGCFTETEEDFLFAFCTEGKRDVDIAREWQKKGIDYGGSIYNFKRAVLTKLQHIIETKPQWVALAELVGRRSRR